MSLRGKHVVIVGGGSGIAGQLAADAVAEGAAVTWAGRTPERYVLPGVRAAYADLFDEESLKALADEVGELDHLVSLAAAPANGPFANLGRAAVTRAFEAKVIGPMMLAKYLAPQFAEGGSMLLFSGFLAWRPAPERTVTATTNGAVAFLAEALAVELAPIRVNALSPGVVDSGAWDRLGDAKEGFFRQTAQSIPARTIGSPANISAAARQALTNPFVTGTILHVDGGARLG